MAHALLVDIKGNLTRKPEVVVLPSGDPICNVGVAVNRRWEDRNKPGTYQEAVSFIDVKVPGQTGLNLAESMGKGDEICIANANLVQESWDKDGQSFSKLVAHCTPFTSIAASLTWGTTAFTKAERQATTAPAAANPLAGFTAEQIAALSPEQIAAIMGAPAASAPETRTMELPPEGEEPF